MPLVQKKKPLPAPRVLNYSSSSPVHYIRCCHAQRCTEDRDDIAQHRERCKTSAAAVYPRRGIRWSEWLWLTLLHPGNIFPWVSLGEHSGVYGVLMYHKAWWGGGVPMYHSPSSRDRHDVSFERLPDLGVPPPQRPCAHRWRGACARWSVHNRRRRGSKMGDVLTCYHHTPSPSPFPLLPPNWPPLPSLPPNRSGSLAHHPLGSNLQLYIADSSLLHPQLARWPPPFHPPPAFCRLAALPADWAAWAQYLHKSHPVSAVLLALNPPRAPHIPRPFAPPGPPPLAPLPGLPVRARYDAFALAPLPLPPSCTPAPHPLQYQPPAPLQQPIGTSALPRRAAPSRCPVVLPRRAAPPRCPAALPRRAAPSRCPVALPRRAAPSRCPVALPRRASRRHAAADTSSLLDRSLPPTSRLLTPSLPPAGSQVPATGSTFGPSSNPPGAIANHPFN
ncbi:hypothetical protein DFH06DRAFT_1145323 [Mycena polygramma]|nr:hypothetical protein DFH06DRAFT_1145323 [Mycena polygramma]